MLIFISLIISLQGDAPLLNKEAAVSLFNMLLEH